MSLLENIKNKEYNHISRNKNSHADKLANDAINEYISNDIGTWAR